VARSNSGASRPERDGGANGYDCISTYGNAKNILTVGAVNDLTNYTGPSSVVMSSFSGWGPTDDGRIKPDLVGNGVSVYSAYTPNNNSYNTISGTSMATPNVSGSLILLQQHHKNLKGTYMKAASLKGLAIHTCDEAGPAPGPDYMFGWGLLNIERAANLLSDNQQFVEEKVLTNSSVYEKSYKNNGAPIRVTLCWTDPEANPVQAALNNPSIRLVNDLDLRIIDEQNNTYLPYILNPFSPSSNATSGDNIRDNVEQVYLFSPTAGRYRVRVTHKGNLVRNPQAYSLIITGLSDVPPVSFTASKKLICKGENITYTNTTSAAQSLTWLFTGGNISSGTQNSHTVTYNQVGKFPVKLTVNFGGIIESYTDTIEVLGEPDASIVDPGTICKPMQGFYRIYASLPGGTWNGTPWMFRTDSAMFFPNNLVDGDYRLVHLLANAAGCSSSDTLFVKIRSNPTVSFIMPTTRYCTNSPDVLLPDGTPSGGIHYVHGTQTSTLSPFGLGAGNYEVIYEYTNTHGCKSRSTQYVSVESCVGYGDYASVAAAPSIVPNPAESHFGLTWNASKISDIKLFNAAGAELELVPDTDFKFDVSQLPRGFYLLQVTDVSEYRHLLKLVLE
jgi:PKD repeat protein